MKIGLSTWAYSWAISAQSEGYGDLTMDAMAFVKKAETLGIELIQFADNLKEDEERLIDAASYARKRGIEVELGVAGTQKKTLDQAIALAKRMGVTLIRTLPHQGDDIPGVDELIERLSDIQGELVTENMRLALENHDHYAANDLRRVMEKTACKQIGICLDAVNNYGQAESFRETFTALSEYIINFHVKDFTITRIKRQTGFSIQGAPAGEGQLDLNYFLTHLNSDVHWIIEQWTPWQGDYETSVALEDQWARTGIKNILNLADDRAKHAQG